MLGGLLDQVDQRDVDAEHGQDGRTSRDANGYELANLSLGQSEQ